MTYLSILFWVAVAIIFYTFLGFPILVTLVARLFPNPVAKRPFTPTVTLLVPAYNEEEIISAKIINCLAQTYPKAYFEIVIVADGSTDETVAVAKAYHSQGVKLFYEPERRGKITAVNRVMPLLKSEIVLFSDANTLLTPQTVAVMMENFADSQVAAVAGEKQVQGGGEGLYWRYESWLKKKDSEISSVMGAAGELFAIRHDRFSPPEADSIIEDFILSMRLVSNGWRVVYEPRAIAKEAPTTSFKADWQRRTRIAAGGFQSIQRLPQLLNPRQGWIWWQYLSHRVLRWAITPFLFPILFLINLFLLDHPFFVATAVGQLLFYLLATVGYWQTIRGKKSGLLYTIFFFCLINLAALVGFWRYLNHSQPVTWQKVR